MNIEFTDDEEFVFHCLTSPKVWRMGIDDAFKGADPSPFTNLSRGSNLWVKTPFGLFIGIPQNFVTYDCHIALLPNVEGKADLVCQQVINFIFTNTRILRLTASIPSYNLLARRLADRCGFKLVGINEKSFLRGGVLHDQHFYGISKA